MDLPRLSPRLSAGMPARIYLWPVQSNGGACCGKIAARGRGFDEVCEGKNFICSEKPNSTPSLPKPDFRVEQIADKPMVIGFVDCRRPVPPKADIGTQLWNVRFVPEADID